MAGTGGPGDAGDGLGARRHRLSGRPGGLSGAASYFSSIFHGSGPPFWMLFACFLHHFSRIEFYMDFCHIFDGFP